MVGLVAGRAHPAQAQRQHELQRPRPGAARQSFSISRASRARPRVAARDAPGTDGARRQSFCARRTPFARTILAVVAVLAGRGR